MTIAPFLEDFGPATRAATTPDDLEVALEDQRLAVFEQGYRAGWDDALAAQDRAEEKASEAFAAALEDLSFPYHEALAQMIANTAPVIRAIVHQVVPKVLEDNLSNIVWEEVEQLLRDSRLNKVEVVAAPARVPLLSRHQTTVAGIDVSIVADSEIDPDRVVLRIGQTERQIDFSGIFNRLEQAASAFEHRSKDGRHNG